MAAHSPSAPTTFTSTYTHKEEEEEEEEEEEGESVCIIITRNPTSKGEFYTGGFVLCNFIESVTLCVYVTVLNLNELVTIVDCT